VIGTDFFVSYEANRTTVICYTGKVSVTPLGNAKVVQNSGQVTQNQIQVSAGQMVVIATEIPPAGYEPETTPPAVQLASMQDTNMPDASPPVRHVHLVRNVVLTVGLAVAGWVIAVTQLNTNAPRQNAPRQKGCQPPNCG
jgi:ferric-dicitrate binding protein FerR (iron transport regulator)